MNDIMPKERIRPFKTVKYILVGIVLCILVGAAGFLGGRHAAASEKAPQLSAVVLESRLAEISELASVTIPFTTKRFILTYDGTIKAGIDLTQVQIDVSGNDVTVVLPEAEILSHEINEDSVEIFDEKSSIFNPFTVEDFTAFQEEQKQVMTEKALQGGLLEEAREKAKNSVRLLLESAMPEDAMLTIR